MIESIEEDDALIEPGLGLFGFGRDLELVSIESFYESSPSLGNRFGAGCTAGEEVQGSEQTGDGEPFACR